ncbi:MAG TPA: hypothetical protein VEB20_06925 [Azospirillaceae bacterium]|nr:hypothetical protein [Azospirillaceae bacterium]
MTASLDRAETLIEAMERLGELFRQETEWVQAQDVAAARAVTEQKHLLVRAYEDAAKTMKVDIDGFASLPPETKARLREVAARFREAAEENAGVLRAAAGVRQSIVNSTVAGINKERAEEAGYTVHRGIPMPAGYRRNAMAAPTTLNTRL